MLEETRKLLTKVMSLISRAVVDTRSSDGTYQVLWASDRASADVEHMEPQGVHFRVPGDGSGALLSPAGNKSASMLLCASGNVPSDALAPGEGGLHYLGTWKVFAAQDGSLHLGNRAPADFVALASLVDARIAQLRADINILKAATSVGLGASLPGNGTATAATFNGSTSAIPAAAASVASAVVRSA